MQKYDFFLKDQDFFQKKWIFVSPLPNRISSPACQAEFSPSTTTLLLDFNISASICSIPSMAFFFWQPAGEAPANQSHEKATKKRERQKAALHILRKQETYFTIVISSIRFLAPAYLSMTQRK